MDIKVSTSSGEIIDVEMQVEGRQQGLRQGRQEEMQEGIRILIKTCRELGLSRDDTSSKIRKEYSLKEEQADEYMRKFWQQQ